MAKIEANGIDLYYELHGPEDADVLVLSNGVLMSTASWAYQAPVLSRHYRVLLYDARGQWQSDHPEGPYTMELHADDLAALLDVLGIERAHIGGTSYGAEISMVFALRYPERTQSLIVTSAVSHVDPLLRGLTDMWTLAARAGDPELLYRVVYPLTFSEEWIAAHEDVLAQARQRYEALDMRAFCNLMDCFAQMDVTADLHNIEVPALVVVGEEDLLKRRIYSEIIYHELPNAEFAIIPHAGHAAMWEQAGVFNTLILGFLAKHAKK
ncbi:MAG: alpha/beta fold hydrolase [Anaerolineae bacterium]|nr:alpha/beta fold hydrolase [Anaerolineae bacterium]